MPEKSNKPHVSVVVVGHVDSGKSTTAGNLIYQCGGIDERTIQKFEKEATEMGRAAFMYAWVLDTTKDERSRGITIKQTTKKCETEKNDVTIIDAPGHKDFIKNMITGAANADFTFAIIPAEPEDFANCIGTKGMFTHQVRLCYTMGSTSGGFCLGINKMDLVDYSEDIFNKDVACALEVLKKMGIRPESVAAIPISGLMGENLTKRSEKMPWYKGWSCTMKHPEKGSVKVEGFTVLDWLNSLIPPKRKDDAILRGATQSSINIEGIGVVVCARIEQGTLLPGTTLQFAPCMMRADVKSIEMHKVQLPKAFPGDNIGMNLKGVTVYDIPNGNVFGDVKNQPPLPVQSIICQLMVGDLPGKAKTLNLGYSPIMDVHSTHIPVQFKSIPAMLSKKTLKEVKSTGADITELKAGDFAKVELIPSKELCCETFSFCNGLGRFALRDSGYTVGFGTVIEIKTIDKPIAKSGTGGKAVKAAAAKKKK